MKQLEEKLRSQLDLDDPGLVGCVRRNLWTADDETPWSHIRGNALLALLGEKVTVQTSAGPFEAFVAHDRWLLQFRGGQWNDYWLEDFFRTWSILQAHSDLDLSDTIFCLHENKGKLTVREIPVPDHLDPGKETSAALQELSSDPPGRISKSGSRAMRVCRYCPVRQRCNAKDKLQGDTDDWSPSYRQELDP